MIRSDARPEKCEYRPSCCDNRSAKAATIAVSLPPDCSSLAEKWRRKLIKLTLPPLSFLIPKIDLATALFSWLRRYEATSSSSRLGTYYPEVPYFHKDKVSRTRRQNSLILDLELRDAFSYL
jgi:hypothetical protein